ncbi:MAG: phosphoribosyltransferase [Acetobacteraceae bacterium]|nr:phosphoribosyltransferase [Acetobacteraceae bacterium]
MSGAKPAWKGLQTDRMPRFISYDEAERMIATLLDQAEAWKPEAVVGIARGGLVAATMASCMLALPLAIVGWEQRGGPMRWIGPEPNARRVLLVDDCCASGVTMLAAQAMLRHHGINSLTMTITHDPDTTNYVPDLSHAMRELFRFPWERGEATPAARRIRASGAAANRLYEKPFLGLDLDGIFLPDVPRAAYAQALESGLDRRHSLTSFAPLPAFDAMRAVVITARPEPDRDRTETWLARCGHHGVSVQCRPDSVADNPSSVARYKAEAATRWGCTHFVESDPEQAIRIAALAPHILVSWWHPEEARSWLIAATSQPERASEAGAPEPGIRGGTRRGRGST